MLSYVDPTPCQYSLVPPAGSQLSHPTSRPSAGLEEADKLSPTCIHWTKSDTYLLPSVYKGERVEGWIGGGAGDNTGKGGDSGSDGEGIWGSGEDHGESGNDGGVDTARSLATSASDHPGVGYWSGGIEILAVTRYAGCGGGVAANSSVSNGSELGALPPPPHHRPRCPYHHPLMTPPRHRRHLLHRQDNRQILLGVLIVILLRVCLRSGLEDLVQVTSSGEASSAFGVLSNNLIIS
ncbi:hypothetical protein Tco_0405677 [Tanacetum coccineum]